MEDLRDANERKLPTLMQYGVKLPFRVAVVGQTDSGKTHSIIQCWLGGKFHFGSTMPMRN